MNAAASLAALAVALILTAPAQATSSGTELARMRVQSEDLARSYLRLWSAGSRGALSDVPGRYGPRVAFYGRFVTRREIAEEKQRFLRRWPIRHYAMRPGTVRTNCDAALRVCQLVSVIDWTVRSPERRKAARGSSRFALGIDFAGARPVVLGENGRVIVRR